MNIPNPSSHDRAVIMQVLRGPPPNVSEKLVGLGCRVAGYEAVGVGDAAALAQSLRVVGWI